MAQGKRSVELIEPNDGNILTFKINVGEENIIDENEKKEEKKKLAVYSQRVHQVQRNDLLILIQYIFYKNYMSESNENKKQYEKKEMMHDFCEYANGILETCGMRLIKGTYMFDAMLLACFGDNDMYLFSEILELP